MEVSNFGGYSDGLSMTLVFGDEEDVEEYDHIC